MKYLFAFLWFSLSVIVFGQTKQLDCADFDGIDITDYGEVWDFLAEKEEYTGSVKVCYENGNIWIYYKIERGLVLSTNVWNEKGDLLFTRVRDGQIRKVHTYENGELVLHEVYENDTIKYREKHKDGHNTSKEIFYRDSSKLKGRSIHTTWYENGQCKSITNWVSVTEYWGPMDYFDGFNKEWAENGQLLFEGNYEVVYDDTYSEIKTGPHRKWYPSGQIKEEINFAGNGDRARGKAWFENGLLRYNTHPKLDGGFFELKCWDKEGEPVECEENIYSEWFE
jgi:antitoxin component YwqK of YwqJK toxin-antitoxin module